MTVSINGTNGLVFNDGSSQATAATGFGFKNRIINGAMVIDQRNAGASVTQTTSGSLFSVDRWQIYGTVTSKFTAQQNAGSVTPPAGFTNYLGITSSSAYSVLTGDQFVTNQSIEGFNVADLGWGTAGAQSITVSFWVRSSLTGSFGGAVANSGYNRSYPFSFTILSANTWEQKTITIAGDTSGTWLKDNSAGIRLYFNLGSGSTYLGTANTWAGALYVAPTGATSVVGTNGATFYITGVDVRKGSTGAYPNGVNDFDYRDYGRELAMCQRYYQTVAGQIFTSENYYDSSGYGVHRGTALPVTMRATPTITPPTTSVSARIGSVAFTGYTNAIYFSAVTTGSNNCYIYFTGNAIAAIEL